MRAKHFIWGFALAGAIAGFVSDGPLGMLAGGTAGSLLGLAIGVAVVGGSG